MIIFGWGYQTIKNFGPAFRQLCSHCNNEEYWNLTRTMTWFTLFFIPIFPYSIKYFLSCPICQYGLTLSSDQIKQTKPIAEVNQLLLDGKITKDEYQTKLNQISYDSSEHIESGVVKTKTLSDNKENLNFCSECGDKVTKEIKFCGNCGVEVVKK